MTPIATIGATFALAFHSFMVLWAFQFIGSYLPLWVRYTLSFFWFLFLPGFVLCALILWLCDGKHANEHRVVPVKKGGA